MNIGRRLKQARIAAKLTQEYVAEMLNVSRQTMSSWENGKSYPDIVNVIAMSDLYNTTIEEMVGEAPKKRAKRGRPRSVKQTEAFTT